MQPSSWHWSLPITIFRSVTNGDISVNLIPLLGCVAWRRYLRVIDNIAFLALYYICITSKLQGTACKRKRLPPLFPPSTGNISLHITACSMGQHLLSIRILFHTTFVFVYLTIIPIVQYIPPSRLWTRSSLGSRPAELSFVRAHFDGLTALSAFVGLGIFAAL